MTCEHDAIAPPGAQAQHPANECCGGKHACGRRHDEESSLRAMRFPRPRRPRRQIHRTIAPILATPQSGSPMSRPGMTANIHAAAEVPAAIQFLQRPLLRMCRINELHPTQITVGLREIRVKQGRLDARRRSQDDERLGLPVPVVVGPDNVAYILDGHHRLRALMAIGVDSVPIEIVEKFPSLSPSAFWRRLILMEWCHPIDAAGVKRSWRAIPRRLANLADDPFRSLAGELRRRGGYNKSSRPFSEFAWAAYLRRHISAARIEENFAGAVREAQALAVQSGAQNLPGWRGTNEFTISKDEQV